MVNKKTILFGGTFDPVHVGHITVAATSNKEIDADKLIFIPAKQTALKTHAPVASDGHRFNMLKLAIADFDNFCVSNYELNKPAPAYTLDTVLYFKEQYGLDTDFYWLIGSDCLGELPQWYKIEQLIDECFICVMYRGGFQKPDLAKYTDLWGKDRTKKLQNNVIETPLINANSTEIRKKLAERNDVSDMLDSKVLDYIKRNRLYKS